MDHRSDLAQLEEALARTGLRLTQARRTIMSTIVRMGRPFTAGELQDAVAEVDPAIGRASVYRVIMSLKDLGYLERLHSLDTEHYTLCFTSWHHHHLTCTDCGETTEFTLNDMDEALNKLVRKRGFAPAYHILEAYGVCPRCQIATSLS